MPVTKMMLQTSAFLLCGLSIILCWNIQNAIAAAANQSAVSFTSGNRPKLPGVCTLEVP